MSGSFDSFDAEIRFAAMRQSLASIEKATAELPEAARWLGSLNHLVIDLTALGCIVRVEILVEPNAPRTLPLDPPSTLHAPAARLHNPFGGTP
jgi:hypothetical protein